MSQIKLKKNNVSVPIRSELKHLFEEIIAQLSRDYKNPNFRIKFPEYDFYYLEIGSGGFEKKITRKQISYTIWIQKNEKKITSLPLFKKSTTLLKDAYKKLTVNQRGILFVNILFQLLTDYLRQFDTSKIKFSESKFDLLLDRYFEEIQPNLTNTLYFIPLYNLAGRNYSIKLQKNFEIRKIRPRELQSVTQMRHNSTTNSLGLRTSFPNEYRKLKYVLTNTSNERVKSIPEKDLKRTINILQLFKTENIIHGNTYFQKIQNWQDDPIEDINGEQNLTPKYKKSFKFTAKDIRKTKNLFDEITKIDWNEPKIRFLTIALDKFSAGIHEDNFSHKILDYAIVLEALYMKEKEVAGITQTISNRITCVLGDNVNQREKIWKDFHQLYALRSKIAHGSDVKKWLETDGKEKRKQEWGELFEEVCRKSIYRLLLIYIKTQLSKDEILDRIQKLLLSGKFYKNLKF